MNPEELETDFQTKTCTQMSVAAYSQSAKDRNTSNALNRKMKRQNENCPNNGILFSGKKEIKY